jgi:hypothetical protein
MVAKGHILDEIRRTASNGSALGRSRFEKETGIKESDWSGRYWTRWSDAIREAGFEPNTMQEAVPEESLLLSIASLIRELRRFPTTADLKMKARHDPNFPSHNTFSRLGKKAERAQRIVAFCSSQGNLDDVVEYASPVAALAAPFEPENDLQQEESVGFVYLMKSGKYYKIGRSVSAEKRAYEIKLQLPEELKLIHKIKTDDPVGIEAYWHQRFADKRQRGEWFRLTCQDVAAFRRRKFM